MKQAPAKSIKVTLELLMNSKIYSLFGFLFFKVYLFAQTVSCPPIEIIVINPWNMNNRTYGFLRPTERIPYSSNIEASCVNTYY